MNEVREGAEAANPVGVTLVKLKAGEESLCWPDGASWQAGQTAAPEALAIANTVVGPGPRGEAFPFTAIVEERQQAGSSSILRASNAALDGHESLHFLADSHVVKQGRARFKLIILSKRNPKLDPAEYKHYWRDKHGELVKTQPDFHGKLAGYVQNYVRPGTFARLDGSGVEPELQFDGMMQMWFDAVEDIASAFGTRQYREVLYPDEENFVARGHSIACVVEETFVSRQ